MSRTKYKMFNFLYIFLILLLTGCGISDLGKPKEKEEKSSNLELQEIISPKQNKNKNKLEIYYNEIDMHFKDFNLSKLPEGNTVTVCSGHGCQHANKFTFSKNQLLEISSFFENVNTPSEERNAIKKVLAHIESIVGPATGTFKDGKGMSFFGSNNPGQLDCVDEANNVTSYLIVLAENNILNWHNILKPTWKWPLFSWNHYVARIQDISTKENWIIDSGINPNAGEPLIITEKQWLK